MNYLDSSTLVWLIRLAFINAEKELVKFFKYAAYRLSPHFTLLKDAVTEYIIRTKFEILLRHCMEMELEFVCGTE